MTQDFIPGLDRQTFNLESGAEIASSHYYLYLQNGAPFVQLTLKGADNKNLLEFRGPVQDGLTLLDEMIAKTSSLVDVAFLMEKRQSIADHYTPRVSIREIPPATPRTVVDSSLSL